jgi:hypothetical protein
VGIVASSTACATQSDDGDTTDANITAITTPSTGLYHWSEGGEELPLFALRALRVDLNGKKVSFMSPENLASYGLMADPVSATNPLGLASLRGKIVAVVVCPSLDSAGCRTESPGLAKRWRELEEH